VSDPAKPVPYRARPPSAIYAADSTWQSVAGRRSGELRPPGRSSRLFRTWLTVAAEDQRAPRCNLTAFHQRHEIRMEFTYKLIDVVSRRGGQPFRPMGGYQLMILADIFRGRYRESLDTPKAIARDAPAELHVRAADGETTCSSGHASWCRCNRAGSPLYDRNPQTFVPNHLLGNARDYPQRPCSGSTMRPARLASSSCRLSGCVRPRREHDEPEPLSILERTDSRPSST